MFKSDVNTDLIFSNTCISAVYPRAGVVTGLKILLCLIMQWRCKTDKSNSTDSVHCDGKFQLGYNTDSHSVLKQVDTSERTAGKKTKTQWYVTYHHTWCSKWTKTCKYWFKTGIDATALQGLLSAVLSFLFLSQVIEI